MLCQTSTGYRMCLERMYQNQLGLEAALIELALHAEQQGFGDVGHNVRGAL